VSPGLKCNLLAVLAMVSLYAAGIFAGQGSYWGLIPCAVGGWAVATLQGWEWSRGFRECRAVYEEALHRLGVRRIEVDHE
jgi:hypothetical protein